MWGESRGRACATGSSRERDGIVTGGSRPRDGGDGRSRRCAGSVTDVGPRHEERENSTLPRVLSDGHGRVPEFHPTMVGSRSGTRPRPLSRARKGTEGAWGVTFPASSSRTGHPAPCHGASLGPRPGEAPGAIRLPGRPWSTWVINRFTRVDHASMGVTRVARAPPGRPGGVTEVRLPHGPVAAVSRTPHVLGVSWRSQPDRIAMRRPGPISDGRDARGRRRTAAAAPHNAQRPSLPSPPPNPSTHPYRPQQPGAGAEPPAARCGAS
jgi:hypothetical protein